MLTNEDNMVLMSRYPDKYFDLAIVDPPYGIGEDWKKRRKTAGKYSGSYDNSTIPTEAYFKELLRVSKNYIIWGWNYYTEFLPPTNYLICWDKMVGKDAFYSHFELAGTNIKVPAVIVRIPWDGGRKGNETGITKIHPHQKPVLLYRWILANYAKEGDKILDTHLGSGSIAIACLEQGFELTACEIDPIYFKAAGKRIEAYKNQTKIEL